MFNLRNIARRLRENGYEVEPAKLQVRDKVYDIDNVEYTVIEVSLTFDINKEQPKWVYTADRSDGIEIFEDGYVLGSGDFVCIRKEDIGVRYFTKPANPDGREFAERMRRIELEKEWELLDLPF